MTSYAQTNIQLYNQLRLKGYSKQEIHRVHQGYELAIQLFGCFFRPSGKTFISHLIGTASILASVHAPVNVVLAGLLHAAYFRGDFGVLKGGMSVENRARVRCVIGEEAEQYVARYDSSRLKEKTIPALCDTLASLDRIDRNLVLVHLANDLEDQLAYGILYWPNAKALQNRIKREGQIKIELAKRLGFPELGAELRRVYHDNSNAEIPKVFHNRASNRKSYPIIPLSYHRRLSIAMYQTVTSAVYRCRSVLRRRRLFVFDR